MTVLDFFVCFSHFLLSMQLVAGKVQEQARQSKTLHLQTAFSPCEVTRNVAARRVRSTAEYDDGLNMSRLLGRRQHVCNSFFFFCL